MIKSNTVVALILAVTLGACSTSGTKVDHAQMAQFHKGTTTSAQVISALGDPSQTSYDDAGNKTLTYVYTQTDVKAQTFIPIVGLFSNGANVKNNTATFTFNKSDVLTKMTQSQGAQDFNNGIGH
jgi:outer membrane protein assembly factor BamE (lipoprotein component of BamABCDE complex)